MTPNGRQLPVLSVSQHWHSSCAKSGVKSRNNKFPSRQMHMRQKKIQFLHLDSSSLLVLERDGFQWDHAKLLSSVSIFWIVKDCKRPRYRITNVCTVLLIWTRTGALVYILLCMNYYLLAVNQQVPLRTTAWHVVREKHIQEESDTQRFLSSKIPHWYTLPWRIRTT